MSSNPTNEIEQIVSAMVFIYNQLEETGIRDHTGKNLEFLFSTIASLNAEQQKARQLMDQVVFIMTRKNPDISKPLVYDRLLFKVVQQALFFTGDKHDVGPEIEQEVNELLNYHPQRDIDIPIIFLDPGPEPIRFGLTTFYKVSDQDWDDVWQKLVKADYKEILTCYARTEAIGDNFKSKDDADQVVNDMLSYLRAVSFPISAEPKIQFGILNSYPPSQLRPYRSGRIKGKHKNLEGEIISSWKIGPGRNSYSIPQLLSSINPQMLSKLQELVENNYRKPKTNMRSKFLSGLHWLGESTKPDTVEARFVKIAIALESLIGGEPNQDRLTQRGLTAALAERGAFIAGDNAENRRLMHESITKFYKKRSEIVHQGNKQIIEQDLIEFSNIVRKISWSLLEKIDQFSDIDSLQEWVFCQRYA
jgi:hypothetical protein